MGRLRPARSSKNSSPGRLEGTFCLIYFLAAPWCGEKCDETPRGGFSAVFGIILNGHALVVDARTIMHALFTKLGFKVSGIIQNLDNLSARHACLPAILNIENIGTKNVIKLKLFKRRSHAVDD